ncbi:AraC family transcriptional regulator [Halarcobacter ebronensis]|uniref:HTH araC/xylS-type domain-containing protein n=1 Tax=Halarcobacter ebronensis TaxID=1462615 RepID=A0A4Q1ARS1_9BACT|nr:AraC family transcriptional regulator [Halarcobacter ebronensis]QKF82739.1 transcriptional regulator, AraC family [Halarcobacter ebronensis]RXK06764.1 hypothetical protein CRV07_04865 [Halarcobacter ebronensis]
MSRYLSSNQLWDTICKKLCYPNSNRGKNNISIKDDYGEININHFSTGFGIIYSSFIANFYEDTIVENCNSYNSSFLSFNTGNTIYMKDSFIKNEMQWDSNICLNGEQYSGHISLSKHKKNQRVMMHYIGFDNSLFKDFTQNNQNYKNIKPLYKGERIEVNFNNHINTHQKTLLNDLLVTSALEDKLQTLYLESKLLELIYASVNSVENQNRTNEIYLSSQDIESLNRAKKILIENITNPPSLKELAYKSAINEFKLKKGFKQLFGNTVYGFLQEYRLNKAKKLLESNEININEASLIVGYKCSSHFSRIFKNQFGITPLEIKKENRCKVYC